MSSYRPWKKFVPYFLFFFLIYIIIVPAVFFLCDPEIANQTAKKELGTFILKIAGIAMLISVVIAGWFSQDPGLREG